MLAFCGYSEPKKLKYIYLHQEWLRTVGGWGRVAWLKWNKHKALSSNPSTTKEQKQKTQKQECCSLYFVPWSTHLPQHLLDFMSRRQSLPIYINCS
jgi:hypothetical protein